MSARSARSSLAAFGSKPALAGLGSSKKKARAGGGHCAWTRRGQNLIAGYERFGDKHDCWVRARARRACERVCGTRAYLSPPRQKRILGAYMFHGRDGGALKDKIRNLIKGSKDKRAGFKHD